MEVKQIELHQPAIFEDEIARALQSEGDSEPAVHGLISAASTRPVAGDVTWESWRVGE